MTSFPAYCPNCKSVFPFRGIYLGQGSSITVTHCLTNCPICGYGKAEIADGLYKATQDAVEVLLGPTNSRAMLEALKALTERLRAGEISKQEAVEEAQEISPRYATLINTFASLGLTSLGLLIALVTLYLQYEGDKSSSETAEKLLKAVTEQTFVLKDIEKRRIERKDSTPTKEKIERKATSIKNKPKRRAQIKKERRQSLEQRRRDFGGARNH